MPGRRRRNNLKGISDFLLITFAFLLIIAGRRKRSSEYFDPCQEYANRSRKCMLRNSGDRDMCIDYFQYVEPNLCTNLPAEPNLHICLDDCFDSLLATMFVALTANM